MMLPILISVSVAPVSYFFWASVLLPLAASKMIAVENAATRRTTKDISFLPTEIMKMSVCYRRPPSGSCAILNTLHHALSITTNATRYGCQFARSVNVAVSNNLRLVLLTNGTFDETGG